MHLILFLLCLSFTLDAGKNKSNKKETKEIIKISAIEKQDALSIEIEEALSVEQIKFMESIALIIKKREQREIELAQDLRRYFEEKAAQINK